MERGRREGGESYSSSMAATIVQSITEQLALESGRGTKIQKAQVVIHTYVLYISSHIHILYVAMKR